MKNYKIYYGITNGIAVEHIEAPYKEEAIYIFLLNNKHLKETDIVDVQEEENDKEI